MRIKNLPSIESMDGSQDALIIEQTDGSEDKSRKVSPSQVKQFIEAGDFEATGEVKDGHGNILKDMAKSADVDAEIGDLSQTGLTGDSVAEQLGDANAALLLVDTTKIKTVKLNKNQSATISANVRDYWAMMAVCYIPGEGGRLLGFVYTNGTGEVKNLWNGNTFSSSYIDFTFNSTSLTVTAKNYNGYVFSFIVTPPPEPY